LNARFGEQEGAAVIAARVDSEVRRGRDHVRVVLVMTVDAADVAEALNLAWWVFARRRATTPGGWDMADATAKVRPR
jgi:hypothetical protein